MVYSLKYQYIYFIYTNLPEIFITYFFIIIFYSIHFFIFFLILHVYLFLLPGLYLSEKKKLYTYIINTISFWLFFFILFYLLLFPLTWGFFSTITLNKNTSDELDIYFETKISEYITFFIKTYIITCLISHNY